MAAAVQLVFIFAVVAGSQSLAFGDEKECHIIVYFEFG